MKSPFAPFAKEGWGDFDSETFFESSLDVVRTLGETSGPEEVAGAALVLAFGNMKVAELQQRAVPSPKPAASGKGMTRLFFTLGRKDRVQTSEILRALAGESGIPGKRVGK